MKKKPFYRWPIYLIERSRFNPLRYLFGAYYLSNNLKKWSKQISLDTSGITIIPTKTDNK